MLFARTDRPTPHPALVAALLFAAVLLGLGTSTAQDAAGDPAPAAIVPASDGRPVLHLRLDSIIHPLAADFLMESLEEAEAMDAEVVIVELSTPGGLLTSTRSMFSAMLATPVPVVVWVAPSGSQAASAGFFLLMAADVAAMAPGTNTGAAHPVAGQGQEIEGPMGEKVEQDAAATIRSLASRAGRNVELAESAVLESRSFSAEEALEAGLVDLIAADLPDLLKSLDGLSVERDGKPVRRLATAGAPVRALEMNLLERILAVLADPNIAYILLTLGGLGLYFEFANPGAILPGVVGAICLVLAFFALSVLPVNYAGVALLILAAFFFLAEIKITSYGILSLAGVVSLVLGSLMLFKGADMDPAIRVSLEVILSITVTVVLVVGFLTWMVVRAHRRQVTTGAEGLVHEVGVARTELAPAGRVFVHGEIWRALSEAPVSPGAEVEVVAVEGLRLRVRPRGGVAVEPEEVS